MADRQNTKKMVQLDNASSSSSSSNSSTITEKSSMEFPKPSPAEAHVEDSCPFTVEEATYDDPTYDPTRIPPSVFSGRPSTCCDWSINSNESLFSIRMGNNSFSRDLAFIVYKSGELMRLDEVFSNPTLPEAAAPPTNKAAVVNNNKAVAVANEEDRDYKKKNKKVVVQKPADDIFSCATSDGSDHSSFAFPILIGNRGGLIPELPSSHRVAWKKSLAETLQQHQHQPARAPPNYNNAPRKTPKSSSGFSSWLSCSCCPFLRK